VIDPISLAMGLAQFAPQVVRWVTGSDKAEQAAQEVVNIAEAVTGHKGQQAIDIIKADPNKVIEFRQAILDREADLDKAFLIDRQDARARDIAYVKAGKTNRRADFMVAMDAIGLISCLLVLGFYGDQIPGVAVTLITTVASIFGVCLRDAHQFEFGSSRGSKEKDEIMGERLK